MVTFDGGWDIVIISKAPYNRYNPPRTCVVNHSSISKLASLQNWPPCIIMIVIQTKVFSLLLLPSLVMGQCANEMPSGACCEADGFFTEADPQVLI